MSWYWQYAGLIALSTIVDYRIGLALAREKEQNRRKLLLIASLGLNLGLLALFKYFNFFSASISDVLTTIGVPVDTLRLDLLLPVGISFYTFQTLSYTIDVYRRKIPTEHSLLKFATYVAFFPQLVAGPIVRASEFLPQLNAPDIDRRADVSGGLRLVFIGLFKKIVIADLLAFLIVDEVFANPAAFSSLDLMVGLYAYAFQIYCDFSGYSDIAIGIALMIGFRLPRNFNKPYLASSPSDFWRRWHITLSEWLRDYLYISLGGNRGGQLRTTFNLLATMLLGGLWHGAAWNFVLWGGYHGLLLALTRNVRLAAGSGYLRRILYISLTFHAVLFGWLLFRVPDMQTLTTFGSGIVQGTFSSQIAMLGYMVLGLAVLSHFLPSDFVKQVENRLPRAVRLVAVPLTQVGLLLLFIGASVGGPVFIYFQF
ncbi:MBOAT family protein [Granulosicoccus sp.]|nr:MBOAT family protein [Granulosicoccus sp.]